MRLPPFNRPALLGSLCLALVIPAGAQAAPLGGDRDPLKMLKQADANRDGQVTRAEFIAARERLFDRLDRNRDGFATTQDLPRRAKRRGGGERMESLRASFDGDGDGRISRREFVGGPSAFDRVDVDRDGVVSREELAQAVRLLDQRRR